MVVLEPGEPQEPVEHWVWVEQPEAAGVEEPLVVEPMPEVAGAGMVLELASVQAVAGSGPAWVAEELQTAALQEVSLELPVAWKERGSGQDRKLPGPLHEQLQAPLRTRPFLWMHRSLPDTSGMFSCTVPEISSSMEVSFFLS